MKLNENDYLFHAGTKIKNEKIYAIGGRVLNFVRFQIILNLQKIIYNNLSKLNWTGGFYRKDIGFRVID